MKILHTFFKLPESEFFRICHFLNREGMNQLSRTNKELKTMLNEEQNFFIPIFEAFDTESFNSFQTWNLISSEYTLKKFYLNEKNLFNNIPQANGCYHVKISWLEIIERNPAITIHLEKEGFFSMPLSLSGEDIHSYIAKNGNEYQNPFNNAPVTLMKSR